MANNLLNKRFKYTYFNAVIYLMIINMLVFIATTYLNIYIKGIPLLYYTSMIPALVNNGFIWQFVTYMFTHADLTHLLLNMLMLFMVGQTLERSLGSKEFLCFYFVSGILSGLISYLIYIFTGRYMVILLGASGALYALFFLFAVLFPNARIVVFFILPVKAPIAMAIFAAICIGGQFFSFGSNTAYLTHLAGFVIAYFYCLIRYRINAFEIWKHSL